MGRTTYKFDYAILRELCGLIQYGYTASAESEAVGPKFLRITDIVPNRINWETVPFCRIDSKKGEQYLLKKGDIVIARTGATTGYAKRIRYDTEAIFASYLVRIRIKEGIDNQYVGLIIESEDYKRFIKTHIGGAAQPNANAQVLTSFPIALPPFPIQRKIATILSAYDDLIENNLRRIKILEEMAQNLYREWFVKFRFPGHDKGKMVDSPLGKIPEAWECGVVNDLLSLKSGFAFKSSTFKEDGTYGLVTIKNVHDGLFVPDCTNRIADLPSNMPSFCHLSTGDVLLSLTGNIGRVCLVYGTDYLLNQRVAKLVPNEANNRAFIYFTFRQGEFQTKLSNIANGVAQQNLSPIETGRMQVVLPLQKVLADFAGVCEPIVEQITALFRKNTTLRRTRDLLLHKLISGELDVSEMDIKTTEDGDDLINAHLKKPKVSKPIKKKRHK